MARQIKIPGMTEKEITESLDACVSENLLKTRFDPPTARSAAKAAITGLLGRTALYFVPDEFKDTLKRILKDFREAP
jgi:hypothetical protein